MKFSLLLFFSLLCNYTVNANDWLYSLDEGRLKSFSENKLILVDFWASWCGPCKKMDMEVWNKEKVGFLQEKYISVKINIDNNKDLALKYNVKSIPAILLLDGLGNVVYQSSGYKSELEMENILSSFDGNVKHLNQVIGLYANNENDPMRNLILAKGYQKYINKSKDDIQNGFIKNSIVYFNRAKKLAKKKKDEDLIHSIELTKIYNDVLLEKPKKVIQQVSKLLEKEKLSEKNLSLAYYTIIKGFRLNGDTVSEKVCLDKLKKLPTSKVYLNRLAKT